MRLRILAPLLLLGITGCSTMPAPPPSAVLWQIIRYGDLVSTSLVTAVPAALAPLHASGQIKDSDYQQAIAAVNALRQASVALDQVSSIDQAKPLIQQIEDSVNVLVSVAATVPLIPEKVRTYLAAVEAGLPVVELIIDLSLNNQPAPAPPPPPAPLTPPPPLAPVGALLVR